MEHIYDLIVYTTFLNVVTTLLAALLIQNRIDKLAEEIKKLKKD